MAKRRHSQADEILLVPFLDILCSLIGVLILIIVVLVVAQSQQTNGRTQEEVERATQYKVLMKQQQDDDTIKKQSTEAMALLQQQQKDLDDKEKKVARLRMLLSSSADIQKTNATLSQNLMKELDNLLLEVLGLKKQQDEFKKEIEEKKKEIAIRKPPAKPEVPSVVVQPGGSGTDKNSKLYFVEAGGGKIVIYWDPEKRTQVAANAEVIVADAAYQYFLKTLKDQKEAKLIFLIRSDGQGAFNNAAGWAMATYSFDTSRIGRLPIPGAGAIDLREFKTMLGTLPPPPEAKLMPAAGAASAPAPAANAPKAPAPAAPAAPKAPAPATAPAPKA